MSADVGLTKPFSFSMLVKEHRLVYDSLEGLYNTTQYTAASNPQIQVLDASIAVYDQQIKDLNERLSEKISERVQIQAEATAQQAGPVSRSVQEVEDQITEIKRDLASARKDRALSLKSLAGMLTTDNRFDNYDREPSDRVWPR